MRASQPPRRVVVALGGNASYPSTIKGTAAEQFDLLDALCQHLVDIIEAKWQLILTHGNGPVVGNILLRMSRAAAELPPMPMDVCVSHSQGGMGYMLQQSMQNVLRRRGLSTPVAAIVTQVEVDADDPAFANPTKPVGRFLSQSEAERMTHETGWQFVEDSGRGYRRVVPSPEPRCIVDLPAIDKLLGQGAIPIAAGGGGIPVVRDSLGNLRGVPAVVDKDLSSALLASKIGATHLVILTAVERVALDFRQPSQRFINRMTLEEARRHYAEGQFPPGSMGPKILAAIRFLEGGGDAVIVTSLENACSALMGRGGTRILRDA